MLGKLTIEAINISTKNVVVYDNVYDINHTYSSISGHEACMLRLLRLKAGQERADWIFVDLLKNDVVIHHAEIVADEKVDE